MQSHSFSSYLWSKLDTFSSFTGVLLYCHPSRLQISGAVVRLKQIQNPGLVILAKHHPLSVYHHYYLVPFEILTSKLNVMCRHKTVEFMLISWSCMQQQRSSLGIHIFIFGSLWLFGATCWLKLKDWGVNLKFKYIVDKTISTQAPHTVLGAFDCITQVSSANWICPLGSVDVQTSTTFHVGLKDELERSFLAVVH